MGYGERRVREPAADRTKQLFLAEKNLRNVVPEHFGSARVAGVWGVVHGTGPPCIRPKADVRQGE